MQIGSFKKIFIAAVLTFTLGGCSAMSSLDPVSLTFGGISYVLTGKGAMDHAVSVASGRDCAILRVAIGEKTCVPKDEDVAGDRLVFRYGDSSWSDSETALVADGDPLSVNPAIAGIVAPLGDTVQVETRSTAIAAVAADTMPIHLVVRTDPEWAGATAKRTLVKDKPAMPVARPARATRLWLPVE